MNELLLQTKFFPPQIRKDGVSRMRLISLLDEGLSDGHSMTLVSAPAGYGKSLLISEWLHSISLNKTLSSKISSTWLNLDENDNDPVRFFTYWISCFQDLGSSFLDQFKMYSSPPPLPDILAALDDIINQLARSTRKHLIVFDDFHQLNNPYITECLEYFIEHQPSQVHLVMIGRADPVVSISRLRSNGKLTEVRARDLRFTLEETRNFLNSSLEITLKEQHINALYERTEGWPSGLQLVVLAMQNVADVEQFVATFQGSHRYILDYLAEEVMRHQDGQVKEFLSKTSILSRFNAPLCEYITGIHNCQSLIRKIEKENLFIIPLDSQGNWYRYHHLFSDYLRVAIDPSESSELFQKAASWFEENGYFYEAMQHVFSANDTEFAADMMERALEKGNIWSGGNLSALLHWLDSLPKSLLYSRPYLSLLAVPIVCAAVRFEQAEQLLFQTELNLSNQKIDLSEKLRALIEFYRGGIALMKGEISKAKEFTLNALKLIPKEDFLFQSRITSNLAQAYELAGELGQAIQYYQKASELGFAAEATYLAINARAAMAFVLRSQGKLHLAKETLLHAIAIDKSKNFPAIGLVYILLGVIAYDQRQMDIAEEHLNKGIELARDGGLKDDVNWGMIFLSRVKAASGQQEESVELMDKAIMMIRAYQIPRVTNFALAYQARMFLETGQIDKAKAWATEYLAVRNSEPVEYLREIEDLTLLRVLIFLGECEQVSLILEPLLETAKKSKRNKAVVEGFSLLAISQHKKNQTSQALETFSTATELAVPEEDIQILVELSDLFNIFQSQILKFRKRDENNKTKKEESPSGLREILMKLPDPLSDQEMRIFDLILRGNTNKEISEELFISIGTAKWHVHNIFQKLGVSNRMQIIALAREWGIISTE